MYCTDTDLTDYLPSNLMGSPLATAVQRRDKLISPATAWIDSVYPSVSPFPPASDARGWSVDESTHRAGAQQVRITGGAIDPQPGETFRVVVAGQWSDVLGMYTGPRYRDAFEYRVETFAGGVLAYRPMAWANWGERSPVEFGTPALVRAAALFYAMSLAYKMLRENSEDPTADAYAKRAYSTLGMPEDGRGHATRRPCVTSDMNPYHVDVVR